MTNAIKRIWNAVTTLLIVALAALAILLWGVRLLGMDVYVVQSGSMEPQYPVGGVVYVKETDPDTLEAGDVITFKLSETTKGTHRIIEIVPDENAPETVRFRTKGDANEHEDSGLVEASNIVGKVVFGLPYLGYLVTYIQQPPGMYMAISAAAVVLLLIVLPDLLFEDKEKKENDNE